MLYTYQYKLILNTKQKLELNSWLRICQYWYNLQLSERFNWWEENRSYIDRCPLICYLPELKNKPNYYSQQNQLPALKKDLLKVSCSGELLDLSIIPAQTLQEICKRVDKTFERYISGDKNKNRSGKPRFKNSSRFRSLVVNGQAIKRGKYSKNKRYFSLNISKLGELKLRTHRQLPANTKLKEAQLIRRADGWYINLRLEDVFVPDFESNIEPNWQNSIGLDDEKLQLCVDRDINAAINIKRVGLDLFPTISAIRFS